MRSPRIWRLAKIFFISLKPGGLQGAAGGRPVPKERSSANPKHAVSSQSTLCRGATQTKSPPANPERFLKVLKDDKRAIFTAALHSVTFGYNVVAGPNSGVLIGGNGSGANVITFTPDGSFTSMPMPSSDVVSLWSATPGQEVQFTVWS